MSTPSKRDPKKAKAFICRHYAAESHVFSPSGAFIACVYTKNWATKIAKALTAQAQAELNQKLFASGATSNEVIAQVALVARSANAESFIPTNG